MTDEANRRGSDASSQLSLEQGRASLALTAAGMGEFEWDASRDEFIVSERMAAITALPAGPIPSRNGRSLFDFVHPEDRERVETTVDEALRREDRYDVRFRMVRPDDGRTRWMDSSAVALRGADRRIERLIGVVRDISGRKNEEDERDTLVAELDHRVKNVLASVQSLASQSARRTVSLDAFLKTFLGRLEAMAAAHTLLTATRWRGAEIANIAAAELGGLAQGQARWEGPDIVLAPRATNALTLALHELGTNAVKFGALSIEGGRVEVRWRALESGGFELAWTESNGPSVSPPSRRGFGSTLLERVTGRELGGQAVIEFRPEGVRAIFTADAAALAAPRASEVAAGVQDAAPPAEAEAVGGASHGGSGEDDITGVRVLIVEDAVLLALELEAGLTEAGAVVVGTAADLEEAEAMLKLVFDVAVLDANLNGLSVMPVAYALAERKIPFIFATGYGDAGAAPEGFEVPVVRKPYNVGQIAAALVAARAAQAGEVQAQAS